LADAAESWCHENGAAFVQEVLDDFDDLCANLNLPGSQRLDPRLRERIKEALSCHVTLDSEKPCVGNFAVVESELSRPVARNRVKAW